LELNVDPPATDPVGTSASDLDDISMSKESAAVE